MTRLRRNDNNFAKSLKDYIVPIIGLLLIIILIYSVFSSWDESEIETKIKYENQIPLKVKVDSDITESYIIYPWENKKLIEEEVELYKLEKILVKEWSVSMTLASVWDFALSKLWELKYWENGELYLDSADLWVNSISKINVNMKYAIASIWAKSHVSLNQNEMWSTIYLLSWKVEVRNLNWKSTILSPGQKIYISNQDSTDDSLDLSVMKESIDDFFKSSDWYIKNNWDSYFKTSNEETEKTSSWSKTQVLWKSLLSFDTLRDEAYVSSSNLNISWTFLEENITKITLNWTEAKIDKIEKSFTINNFSVLQKENDLVFKIYDDSNDVLQKFVYTVYNKWWWENTTDNSQNNPSNNLFQVKNYNIDWSMFTFSSPSTSWNFTTTAWFVTIKWNVLAKWVAKITVNDYPLGSFNWSSWRYHANVDYNNLKDGTNIYDVKYYDADWNLVYNNNFTIIKKPISGEINTETNEETPVTTEEPTTSDVIAE